MQISAAYDSHPAEVTMVLMSRDQSFAISWKTQAGPAPV